MGRTFVTTLLVLLITIPLFGMTSVAGLAPPLFSTPTPTGQGKALILSSLEQYAPMGYRNQIEQYLTNAGYQVTFMKDTNITVNFLETQLNNYDLFIWRTNVYSWNHTTYWYVGELSTSGTAQTYASDISAGYLDGTNGIIGVSFGWFHTHFGKGSLANVKLAILVSSESLNLTPILLKAGVESIIAYYGDFSIYDDMVDYGLRVVFSYLAEGRTVQNAVQSTVMLFYTQRLQDPLDSFYIPPIFNEGNSTLTIKP